MRRNKPMIYEQYSGTSKTLQSVKEGRFKKWGAEQAMTNCRPQSQRVPEHHPNPGSQETIPVAGCRREGWITKGMKNLWG